MHGRYASYWNAILFGSKFPTYFSSLLDCPDPCYFRDQFLQLESSTRNSATRKLNNKKPLNSAVCLEVGEFPGLLLSASILAVFEFLNCLIITFAEITE